MSCIAEAQHPRMEFYAGLLAELEQRGEIRVCEYARVASRPYRSVLDTFARAVHHGLIVRSSRGVYRRA